MRRAGLLLLAVPQLVAATALVRPTREIWFGTDANTVGRATLSE
jgi:hypothetical protein